MAQDETAGGVLRIYGYYHAGQYSQAVEEYLALADKGKLCDKARVVAALAYLKNNDSNSADQLIGKIDLKKVGNPVLYADVARYYLERGDLKQARNIALEGISLDDTCLENYFILIELARKENSSDTYYSYMLLTRSTDPVAVLKEELKEKGIEVRFINLEQGLPDKKQVEENTTNISEQGKTVPNNQPNKQSESEPVAPSSLNALHPVSREEGIDLVKNLPEVKDFFARTSYGKVGNWGDHYNKAGILYYLYRAYEDFNDPNRPQTPTFDRYYVDSTSGEVFKENHGDPQYRYQVWTNGNWVPSKDPV